jgi:hypothetical protein
MNRGQLDRNGRAPVRTSRFATTSRLPTIRSELDWRFRSRKRLRRASPYQRNLGEGALVGRDSVEPQRQARPRTKMSAVVDALTLNGKSAVQRPKNSIRPQQPPWPEASRSIRHARVSFPR